MVVVPNFGASAIFAIRALWVAADWLVRQEFCLRQQRGTAPDRGQLLGPVTFLHQTFVIM